MKYIYGSIIIILFLLFLTYIFDTKTKKDHFYTMYPAWDDDAAIRSNIFPVWNAPTRSTRNMSYDLRGDVPIPDTGFWSPFNMSTLRPIQNKPLWMVS